ncbi:unnamed protein product [Periconia digitata]|uniref:IgE-binding protein n=1 Tax=Periconia digitata TaxID=1303443 RepID=A0A9W4UDY5_9PLEO|nr:unnamed protein product [Periconia digitata]
MPTPSFTAHHHAASTAFRATQPPNPSIKLNVYILTSTLAIIPKPQTSSKMKTSVAFSALFANAMAQGYFGVMSARSASPVHLLPLEANGGHFFLSGENSAHCPSELGEEVCAAYPGNGTVLAGGEGTLSLGVVVPGGQQIYVAPDGALSYTQPHSVYKPEGSVVEGWSRTEGEALGQLSFSDGLVACPTVEGKPWQVYGQLPGLELSPDCLGFSAITVNTTGAVAWEY